MTPRILRTALLLIVVQLVASPANAQFGLPDAAEVKAMARAKKLEKSPARDEIKKIEEGITQIEHDLSFGSLTMAFPDSATYAELDAELKVLEALEPVIKEKDPKWAAKNDYATPIATHRANWKKKSDDYWMAVFASQRMDWLREKSEDIKWDFFNDGDFSYLGNNYRSLVYITTYSNLKHRMADFDYKGTKERLASIIKEDPALESSEFYQNIKTFYDKTFPEFINGPALEFLDEIVVECTAKFKESPTECYGWLADGINYCTYVLALFPNNTPYSNKRAELEKLKLEFDKYLDEKVYTSAFHKAHAGEVLFSNKPIVIGQEKEEDFKTTFKAGEGIYAVLYRMRERPSDYNFSLFINDEIIFNGGFVTLTANDESIWASYYTFAILPDPQVVEATNSPIEFESMKIMEHMMSYMEANTFGEKKLKIGLYSDDTAFFIDYSTGHEEMKEKFQLLKKQRGAALRLPKAVSSNADIVAQWTKAVLEPGESVIAARVLSPGWEVDKNKYGIITGRYATVYAVVKNKNGVCTMLGGTVTQEKGDGGYQSPEVYLDTKFYNSDKTIFESAWDGTERINGEEGFQCDCSAVTK